MKRVKSIMLVGALLLIVIVISIMMIRRPSYTIQTNGELYIVNKLSSSISVFDLQLGKTLVELPLESEPHEITRLSDQNRVVVTNYGSPEVEGNSITIINTKTHKIEKSIELKDDVRPHGIVNFSNTSKVGLVTDQENNFLLVDLNSGIIEKKIPTRQKFSHLLALHPSKPILYVTNSNSNSISVIDLERSQVVEIIQSGKGTEGIDITSDGAEIWVTNHDDNSIDIFSSYNYDHIKTLKSGEGPTRLKFSIDGNYCLVTNSKDGKIIIYDVKRKELVKSIQIPGKNSILEKILYHTPRPVGIHMHPNGLYAFVSNSNANQIEVIDMKKFEIVSSIKAGKIPDGLTVIE